MLLAPSFSLMTAGLSSNGQGRTAGRLMEPSFLHRPSSDALTRRGWSCKRSERLSDFATEINDRLAHVGSASWLPAGEKLPHL